MIRVKNKHKDFIKPRKISILDNMRFMRTAALHHAAEEGEGISNSESEEEEIIINRVEVN